MGRRNLLLAIVTLAGGISWLTSAGIAGQTAGGQPIPAELLAPKGWTPPRTPWGDPDLQGTYTNNSEGGTPFERPAEFGGRRLEDVRGEELAQVRRRIQNQAIERTSDALSGPNWFNENLSHDRGLQAWLIVDPPDGKLPPETPEARQRAAARQTRRGAADSHKDFNLFDRCITRGLPGSMMPAIYGNSYEIVQGPGFVAIRYEMIHEARVIPLDGRPRSGASIRQYMGDARGRWEGNTLVVETTNFRDEAAFRGANGGTLRITERFTAIRSDAVKWAVTVDDPSTWTRSWTFAMPLTRDDQPLPSYECHEGNLGLQYMLSAARAEEARAGTTPSR
jgi:hypothetical protein